VQSAARAVPQIANTKALEPSRTMSRLVMTHPLLHSRIFDKNATGLVIDFLTFFRLSGIGVPRIRE
jgi:hypothetical protein